MRRHIVPFLVGFAGASFVFVLLVLPRYGRDKYEYGLKNGAIMTKIELVEKIPKTLGDDYKESDGYTTFFEVKASAVVVVERNGVKTLRSVR